LPLNIENHEGELRPMKEVRSCLLCESAEFGCVMDMFSDWMLIGSRPRVSSNARRIEECEQVIWKNCLVCNLEDFDFPHLEIL
jgi:hypothetical protein